MMEPNEIAALNYYSKEIGSKMLVSSSVLRKLNNQKMLSRREEEMIKQIRDGCKQNSKLVEIIKKKPGGFQALTEALLLEKRANEHYVNKMRTYLKKLNSKQRVVPEAEDTYKQATYIRELEQKVKELEHLHDKMASLVFGSSATLDNEEDKNLNAMVNELEKTRRILKMREKPLSDTVQVCRMNSEKVKNDLAKIKDSMQKLILQHEKEIKKFRRKMDEIQNQHEEIIREKVDVQVRERLVRLKLNDTNIVEPNLTLNPDQMESENDHLKEDQMEFENDPLKEDQMESEIDPLKESCPVSHRTDLSTSRSTQPLPNVQPINIHIQGNVNTLQISKDHGNNIALQK